jgi:hypothetical protein
MVNSPPNCFAVALLPTSTKPSVKNRGKNLLLLHHHPIINPSFAMSTPEAMDYDYFDDEELINDYVQEPFEPEEEEYPADFLAYMEQPTQQQPTIAGVTSRVSLPATAVSALGDDCDPPAVSGNDFDRDQENVPVQEINIQSTSETEADLYSFER